MMSARFADRADGGRQLARKLDAYRDRPDVIVLGLPRGGVPVAYEVATFLRVPLDVFIVRKLGVPGYAELAMGAIASGGVRVLNEDVLKALPNAQTLIDTVSKKEEREIERRENFYRRGRPAPDFRGLTVIAVDDGLATGATMRAAVAALRQRGVEKIVVAVPGGSTEACQALAAVADEIVRAVEVDGFTAVGELYNNFSQTSDEEVTALLDAAAQSRD